MIEFTQVGEGKPRDVQVVTDDSCGELAAMEDSYAAAEWEDAEGAANLAGAEIGEDGTATFIIPGREAADTADIFETGFPDVLPLMSRVEEWNEAVLGSSER